MTMHSPVVFDSAQRVLSSLLLGQVTGGATKKLASLQRAVLQPDRQ
jgi:hypothetical protein